MTDTPEETQLFADLARAQLAKVADRVAKAEAKAQNSISTAEMRLLLRMVTVYEMRASAASRPPLGVAEGRGK